MYTVNTNYFVPSMGYAEFAVHNTEYSICTIKYTVHFTADTTYNLFAL